MLELVGKTPGGQPEIQSSLNQVDQFLIIKDPPCIGTGDSPGTNSGSGKLQRNTAEPVL